MKDKDTKIRDVMTTRPHSVDESATVSDAARIMHDDDVGGVIVTHDDGTIAGFITDRDIVIRVIAEDHDCTSTRVGQVCSTEMVQLSPDQTLEDATRAMAEHSVRRIPVVEDGKPVGVVSLGDLAQARDPDSVLGAISSAPPNM